MQTATDLHAPNIIGDSASEPLQPAGVFPPKISSASHPIRHTFEASGQLGNDIVDDARDGAGRVDIDPGGKVSTATMVAEYQRTLVRLETRLIWPSIQSSVQRLDIYIEHENLVE